MPEPTAACPECGETELPFIRTVCKRCYLRHWRAGTHHSIPMRWEPSGGPMSVVRTEKRCPRCKTTQPIDEFPISRGRVDGRAGHCKACCRAKYDPEKFRDYQLRRKYGISAVEFDALLAAQGGGCAICSVAVNQDANSLAVDHCHTTGVVRGILCGRCNKALGLFQDDPTLLERAVIYLRK